MYPTQPLKAFDSGSGVHMLTAPETSLLMAFVTEMEKPLLVLSAMLS
jgi:hypothetical protein